MLHNLENVLSKTYLTNLENIMICQIGSDSLARIALLPYNCGTKNTALPVSSSANRLQRGACYEWLPKIMIFTHEHETTPKPAKAQPPSTLNPDRSQFSTY
jgi:hypothetical protein